MSLPLFPFYSPSDEWDFCDFWEWAANGDLRLAPAVEEWGRGAEDPGYPDVISRYFIDEEFGWIGVVRQCPFCGTQMATCEYVGPPADADDDEHTITSVLGCCPYCTHWQWVARDCVDGYPDTWYDVVMTSKLRTFKDLPAPCSAELAQAMRADRRRWHTIGATVFERFVGDVLRANYAECEVMHVGRSHDRGVDLVFVDAGQKQHLVQVKRREGPDRSEGAPTVRSLLGAMAQAGQLRGILVSTAKHFTREANRAVLEGWLNFGFMVELVDRGKLNRMLDPLMPEQPWRTYIGRVFPTLVPYFGHAFPARQQLRVERSAERDL